MKNRFPLWLVVSLCAFSPGPKCLAEFRIIQRVDAFTVGRITGIAVADSTIYGVTESVELFSVNLDGTQFNWTELPHEEDQQVYYGSKPGALAIANGKVVGSFSASHSDIYTVNFDGADFSTIARANDTGLVFANPIAIGDRIYGASERGVFALNTDGSGLQIFESEIKTPSNVQLQFDGDRIYGATWPVFSLSPSTPSVQGGKLFSMKPDGTDYVTLRELSTSRMSMSSIDVFDGKIYGLQDIERGSQKGLKRYLISMNVDGSDYDVLHEFQGGQEDGANAIQVVAHDNQLFGVTRSGGTENQGVLFRSNTDGSDYQIVHNFGYGLDNGTVPNSDLVVIGSTLYGSTLDGYELNVNEPRGGIVYSIALDANPIPEPQAIVVWLGLGTFALVIAKLRQQSTGRKWHRAEC